ncbi:type IV secretion system protein [Sulfurospirillum arcachonense]|uniref:type IV secretion system protein n=1 Tax=Sulfurospirillum arcachonense TaxID=57666 RepID=UPI00046AFFBD|nr:VirB8/TrbF family protein [Sulfurospirillum arcachonense]
MFEQVKDAISLYLLEKNLTNMLFKINMVQSAIIFILVICIISLFPLKEKEPYFVNFSNADMNFIQVRKANEEMQNDIAVQESLVNSYVYMRETKNNIDDRFRTERVRLQSTFGVWKDFGKIFKNENSIYQNKEITREIKLLNTSFIPNNPIAQIDFQATTKRNGEIIKVGDYRVVVQFHFKNEKMKFEDMKINPTTFKVNSYSLSEIRTKDYK